MYKIQKYMKNVNLISCRKSITKQNCPILKLKLTNPKQTPTSDGLIKQKALTR